MIRLGGSLSSSLVSLGPSPRGGRVLGADWLYHLYMTQFHIHLTLARMRQWGELQGKVVTLPGEALDGGCGVCGGGGVSLHPG